MEIREATSRDVPTLIDFQLKLALETENITLEISELSLGVQRMFKDSTKGHYYVAEETGEVIGCLMTTAEWSEWHNGTVLWIQSVYIPKEHRGKGVYKTMYEFIKTMVVNDPEMAGIRLYVDKANHAAQQVYKKLGMNGEHYATFEWMRDN